MLKCELETVHAAGGLVIDKFDRVLFIFKDGKWDLPKGLIDTGETSTETAIKEVCEETGINKNSLNIISELIPTHHISKYKKQRYIKLTNWFLISCNNSSHQLTPQTLEGIEHCQWINQWELQNTLLSAPIRIKYLINYWLKFRKTQQSKL